MALAEIQDYINSISDTTVTDYANYWKTITPATDQQYYNRWRFAFLSVHCSWKSNVRAYSHLEKSDNPTDKQQLQQQIVYTRVGLIKMRTNGLWKFQQDYWADPRKFRKKADENWDEFRDRTMNMCHGLGYAKSAFAIELCYPNECEVTCLDTHALQLYEYDTKKLGTPGPAKYKEMEKHWVETCKARNIPQFMARNIYWDKVQEQPNSRYWSSVFETPETVIT